MPKTNTSSKVIPDYKFFSQLSEIEQLAILVQLEEGYDQGEALKVKNLINAIYHADIENSYRKKLCLKIYSFGVFNSFFQPSGLLEKISELSEVEDSFVLQFALKCVYRLHMFTVAGLNEWLQAMILHQDADVRAEAYHCRARLHFYQGLGTRDIKIYGSSLANTISDCKSAVTEVENRIDAQILHNIAIGLQVVFLNQSDDEYNNAVESAKKKLFRFISFNGNFDEIVYFINILNTTAAIRRISKSDPTNWLEIRKELIILLVNMQEMDIKHLANNPMQNALSLTQTYTLREGLVKNILLPKLRHDIYRLKRLEDEGLLETEKQSELLRDIIVWIEESESVEHAYQNVDLNSFTKFHDAFPLVQAGKLKELFDAIDVTRIENLLELFLKIVLEHKGETQIEITTGIPTGDEILRLLIAELSRLLPDYDKGKFLQVCFVLRDVINYLINAMRGSKRQFEFLFKTDAKEVELQDSMMIALNLSDRSSKYIPEVKDFADGGRVDIVYKSDQLELPIELKRSFESITWDKVKADYIAQAQTYANTRDQLAIFIVLDLSDQIRNQPETNIRNLFSVLNIAGRQNLPVSHPDYVIAFVLPGNKMLPSQRSVY